jgi:hypothetical protein
MLSPRTENLPSVDVLGSGGAWNRTFFMSAGELSLIGEQRGLKVL